MTTLLMGILLMMSPNYTYANEVIQPSVEVTETVNINNEQLIENFDKNSEGLISIEDETNLIEHEIIEEEQEVPVIESPFTKEYLHITQPLDNTTTFDSQINMMGEAIEGIEIVIVVSQDEVYNLYDVGIVGATETFNQLIDLYEGDNFISVAGRYDEIVMEETFQVRREPKKNKDKLQNFVITGTEDLPLNLKTNNEETAETLPETT
ncbi:MAG: hypothetical protein ATN32_02940 [Candidatus Epulonipiscium fishelsonii]|nr:MAG: hypothetical protein ATN32_02940 [Epulopiscium sp. AS2M-Bin002]